MTAITAANIEVGNIFEVEVSNFASGKIGTTYPVRVESVTLREKYVDVTVSAVDYEEFVTTAKQRTFLLNDNIEVR